MKTIYRLEAKNKFKTKVGEGPYTNNIDDSKVMYFTDIVLNAHNHGDSHPSIEEDFSLYDIPSNNHCACETLEDLKNWFRGYMAHAKRVGFGIAEYKVIDYIVSESGKQVIFNKYNVISKKFIS